MEKKLKRVRYQETSGVNGDPWNGATVESGL